MDVITTPSDRHDFNEIQVCAHCQMTRTNAVEINSNICWTKVARARVDEVLRFELRELFKDNMVVQLPDSRHAFEEYAAPHTDEVLRITHVTYGAHGNVSRLIRFIDGTVAKLCRDLRDQERRSRSRLYLVWRVRPEVYPYVDDRTGQTTDDWCFRMRLGAAWGPEGIVPRADPPKAPPTGELTGLGRGMAEVLRENFSDWFADNAWRVYGFAKHSFGEQCIIADPTDPCDTYHLRETVLSTLQRSPIEAVDDLRFQLKKAIRTSIDGMTDSHRLVLAEKGPATYESFELGQVTGKYTVIVQAIPASFAPRRTVFYEPHRYKCCGEPISREHAPSCEYAHGIKVSDYFKSTHAHFEKHGTCEIELPDTVTGSIPNDAMTEELRARAVARTMALLKSFEISSKEAREKAAAAAFNNMPVFSPEARWDSAKAKMRELKRRENGSPFPPAPVDERPAEAIAAAFELPAPAEVPVSEFLCATPMPHMREPSD